jgi:CheY-like chemotaxis protein/anti-sigma regulatory factor (Ser/Thr protein kinase)
MEALGQLTGGIAHDSNNLLTVILGNAEVLAEEITDPRLRDLAQQIEAAAERGSDLNQKLLAFGRRQSLKPTFINPDEVITNLAVLLKRAIGEHIELRTVVSGGQALALVDRTQLESAILNLAVNARDAMTGGGTLTIEAEEICNSQGEAEYIHITVKDTGTGMPPEVLERVWEPFFTTKEIGKGSGLGLAMVYGFVEQSGGHVSITSAVGEGTSVTILLPVAKQEARTDQPLPSGKAVLPSGSGTILVLEDDADVRRYATSTLLSLGYKVLEAPDGEAALELLRHEPRVDLLFSDIVLPRGMNGLELARKARALRPNLHVIFASGYPEDVFKTHGHPHEETILIAKPYKRAALAEAVRRTLDPLGKEAVARAS